MTLTDADGRQLGPCINPQPTWSLLHAKKPADAGACPFALMPLKPCTCVADVLTQGGFRLARDGTGLIHFAVPLIIDSQSVGAVLAGQVFDQFPEQLILEHVARAFSLNSREAWRPCLEHPVKQTTLRVYAGLLTTLADHFLQSRYHTFIEGERLAQMMRLGDQLRQRSQELTESNQRKDQFLAMLAHELRNPLAPIRNASQVVRLLAQDNPHLRWAGDVIGRQVQHLRRLVDDLLDVSRFSSGKITLRKEPTDVAAVVARAVETARPVIEERRHELSVTLPPERLQVQADSVRLAQVLENLLNNAAKYTPEGGRIWLTAEREGQEVVVRVRDTGIGIPADMLARVFDLFTQVDRTLDRAQGGLGIGLTLVKSLVELHGGTVQASSMGLNQGSEVVVRLPFCRAWATLKRAGKRKMVGPPQHPGAASWWWMITSMRQTALRSFWSWRGTRFESYTMERRPSKRLRLTSRKSSCWTLACPGWTATKWRGGCASSPRRIRRCWWP